MAPNEGGDRNKKRVHTPSDSSGNSPTNQLGVYPHIPRPAPPQAPAQSSSRTSGDPRHGGYSQPTGYSSQAMQQYQSSEQAGSHISTGFQPLTQFQKDRILPHESRYYNQYGVLPPSAQGAYAPPQPTGRALDPRSGDQDYQSADVSRRRFVPPLPASRSNPPINYGQESPYTQGGLGQGPLGSMAPQPGTVQEFIQQAPHPDYRKKKPQKKVQRREKPQMKDDHPLKGREEEIKSMYCAAKEIKFIATQVESTEGKMTTYIRNYIWTLPDAEDIKAERARNSKIQRESAYTAKSAKEEMEKAQGTKAEKGGGTRTEQKEKADKLDKHFRKLAEEKEEAKERERKQIEKAKEKIEQGKIKKARKEEENQRLAEKIRKDRERR